MKFVLGAVAAALIGSTTAFVQPAEARCFWNGFAMECYHPAPFYWHERHFYRDFDRPYFRDWY